MRIMKIGNLNNILWQKSSNYPSYSCLVEEVGAEAWNRWFPDNPLVDGKPAPFRWDEERRAALRAELDAIYAHLYGLTKEELDYILETFPIVKRKDVEKYGSYRTKEMILSYYDRYAGVVNSLAGE